LAQPRIASLDNIEDMSYREIAAAINVPVGTVIANEQLNAVLQTFAEGMQR